MQPLQVLGGLLLTLVLPGYLLVKAVLPHGPTTGSRRTDRGLLAFLSVTLSVALTILVGTLLGFQGRFAGFATGTPTLEASLAGVSLVLFLVALRRGAFPHVSAFLGRDTAPPREPRGVVRVAARVRSELQDLQELRHSESALTGRILKIRLRNLRPQPESEREHRRETLEALEARRRALREEAQRLEDLITRHRYGGSA